MVKPLISALLVLICPLFEYLCLRFYVRQVARIRLGFGPFTDFDFVFTLLLAFLLLVIALSQTLPIKISFSRRGLCFNAVSILLFGVTSHYLRVFYAAIGTAAIGSWFLLAGISIASSLFIWVEPAYFYKHPKRWLMIPALLVGLCDVISKLWLTPLWPGITRLTGVSLFSMVKPFYAGTSLKLVSDGVLLAEPNHNILVGFGCSGLNGIILFMSVGIFLMCLYYKKMNLSGWFLALAGGAVLALLLNLARLFIFYNCLMWAHAYWPQGIELTFAIGHDLFGWLVYTSGLVFYWQWVLAERQRVVVPTLVEEMG